MAENGMSDAALQQARKSLQIADVWQHQVAAFISEDLQASASFPDTFELLFKHLIARTLWGKADGDDDGPYVFRVHIDLGVRYVDTGESEDNKQEADASLDDQQESPSDKSGEAEALAQIEATYVAEYRTSEDLPEDALKAFAFRNASYHVWPFWREFLASQCNRMNLPRVSLPLQSIAQLARSE
jgi:hypothetical protein